MVTASMPPDEQDLLWLRATAQGDRGAFASLYRRHHGRLARFLWRMTRRRDLIDDTINDTMWIVWRKAEGFRGDSKVSTWITGIAYRCMLKALREAGDSGEGNVDAAALERRARVVKTQQARRPDDRRLWRIRVIGGRDVRVHVPAHHSQ